MGLYHKMVPNRHPHLVGEQDPEAIFVLPIDNTVPFYSMPRDTAQPQPASPLPQPAFQPQQYPCATDNGANGCDVAVSTNVAHDFSFHNAALVPELANTFDDEVNAMEEDFDVILASGGCTMHWVPVEAISTGCTGVLILYDVCMCSQ